MTLTEDGLEDVAKVVQAVFQYSYLLANLTEEEFQQKWEDFREVAKVNFDYAEKESPNDYAV